MNKLKLSLRIGLSVILLLISTNAIYANSDNLGGNGSGQVGHEDQGNNLDHANNEEHATFGNIQQVSSSTLTIQSGNEPLETEVDKKTKVFGTGKKVLRLNQLKIDDKVAIIGSESGDTQKEFRALKIFVKPASSSAEMKRRAVEGVVTSISGSTITLVHQIHTNRVTTITVSPSAVIKLKGIQNATLADITVDQRIVAIGTVGSDGTLIADRIHIIPGLAKGVFNRFPTQTPTSSESASITPSISVTPSESITPVASTTGTVTPTFTPTETITSTP